MSKIVIIQILSVLLTVLVIFFVIRILRENRSPSSTLLWAVVIIIFPYAGIPLYLLIGGRRVRRHQKRKMSIYPDREKRSRAPLPEEFDNPLLLETIEMLEAVGQPVPTAGNYVNFFDNGVAVFKELIEMIESATESINIATYILGRDNVGRRIIELLSQKAKKGVKVRLLLDGFGAFGAQWFLVRPLRKAGGAVGVFGPIWPLRLSHAMHLRNHRKMVIVDQSKALVGGMNLAREYMGPKPNPLRWADTGVIIQGPAVMDFMDIFVSDWEFATGEEVPVSSKALAPTREKTIVQVVASGPDAEVLTWHDAITLHMMYARKRIWIVTPYFIPDESLLRLLRMMARMGRDVRIVVPKKSNYRIADMARGSFFRQLSESDITFYGYEPGMLHAKLMVIDDETALVGSANMDVRSLYLDYEAGAIIYSKKRVQTVATTIENYMLDSIIYTPEQGIHKNFFIETVEDVCRLFAPLL